MRPPILPVLLFVLLLVFVAYFAPVQKPPISHDPYYGSPVSWARGILVPDAQNFLSYCQDPEVLDILSQPYPNLETLLGNLIEQKHQVTWGEWPNEVVFITPMGQALWRCAARVLFPHRSIFFDDLTPILVVRGLVGSPDWLKDWTAELALLDTIGRTLLILPDYSRDFDFSRLDEMKLLGYVEFRFWSKNQNGIILNRLEKIVDKVHTIEFRVMREGGRKERYRLSYKDYPQLW